MKSYWWWRVPDCGDGGGGGGGWIESGWIDEMMMLDWKVAWWWWRWWWWCFVLMTSAWDVSEKFFSGWMYDSTLLIEGSINSIRLYFIKLTKDFVLEDDISSDISAARTRVPLFAMKFRSKFRYGRKTKKHVTFRFGKKDIELRFVSFRFMLSTHQYS